MALKVENGVLTAPGATGNQTVTLADTGFGTVKAVLLWAAYNTAAGDVGVSMRFHMGFGTFRSAAVQQWCSQVFSVDTLSTSETARGASAASILRGYSEATTPTVDFDAELVSLDDAQFVLNWTDFPTSAIKVHYLALGGSDITDALVDTFDLTTGAGTQDETVASGFGKPDLLFSLSSLHTTTANQDFAAAATMFFGVGKSDTEEAFTAWAEQDAAGTMALGMAQKSSFIGFAGVTAITYEAELTARASWPTDGFQINKLTLPAGTSRIGYLALKGSFTAVVGSGVAPIAGSPPVTQDLAVGQTPRGALLFHHAVGAKAGHDATDADLGMIGVGALDGTHEGWAGAGQDDGDTTSDTHVNHSETKAIRYLIPNNSGGALQSEADGSFSGTNVRLSWNDIDSVAREYRYVLLGDAAGGANITGASSLTLSFNVASAGVRTRLGASTLGLVFGFTSVGVSTRFASSTLGLVFGVSSAGRRGAAGASSLGLVFGASTSGQRSTFGASSLPLVFGASTSSQRTTFGASALPLVFGLSTSSQRTTFGASALPFVFGLSTSSQRSTFGASSLPLVFGVSSSGTRSTFGASSLPLVFGIASSGQMSTFGASSLPLVFGLTSSGSATRFAASSLPIVFSITSAGEVDGVVTGSSSLTLSFGVQSQGVATRFASSTLTLNFGIASAGAGAVFGASSLPLVFGVTSAAQVYKLGSSSLPIVFSFSTGSVAVIAYPTGGIPFLAKPITGHIDSAAEGRILQPEPVGIEY